MSETQALKEEGNNFFKQGKYEEALSKYTEALTLTEKSTPDAGVFYKNRAACYIKLEKYEKAAEDASRALEISPRDTKALFRRCQALEQLGKTSEAYKDGMRLLEVEPKNTAIQPIMRRLSEAVQSKAKEQETTDQKVTQMFNIALDDSIRDKEKVYQAANNLIVLAREEAGAEKIYNSNGILSLLKLLESKDPGLQLASLRAMACMAKNSKTRALGLLERVGMKTLVHFISMDHEDISTSASHLLLNIIYGFTNLENIREEKERFEEYRRKTVGCKARPFPNVCEKIDPDAVPIVDEIFNAMLSMLNSKKVSAYGRDNIMEMMTKIVTREDGVGWSKKMIEVKGIQKLVEVAASVPEHKGLPISNNSRMNSSLVLSKIYEDLLSDQERHSFRDAVDEFLTDLLGDDIMESKIEAIMAISALLQGPYEVGNSFLGRSGIMEIMLAMAESGNQLHIKIAVEALVHSTSKKDKCSSIIKQATPILKKLYQSGNDAIKVRALVGLCKLGSLGGSDASAKSFAEGSNQTLAKACRKFLTNPAKDNDLRKWAAEGLAFLSLDAEVKEDLVNDTPALTSLLDLARVGDKGVLYPVTQVLVNVTNSYDQPNVDPEMIELAKFAKQHVPEKHEKDGTEFVKERVRKIIKAGVAGTLVMLSKTESHNTRELLARVFLAVAMEPEHRGALVQQGGGKALIPLALDGNVLGKAIAAQALAKIAITSNPEIAFPGQRCCELVRPLLLLLDMEKTALQNFEALMALTNISSVSDTVRQRILKEDGFSQIEHYMFEEHEMLRRAATECMCNMVMCDKVVEKYTFENDRVKLLVLYCGEEDIYLVRAAAGCLAIMSHEEVIARKITTCTTQWYEIMQILAVHENPEIQHRGVFILMNIMAAAKDLAEKLVEGQMLEVLMALSKLEEPGKEKIRECAEKALKIAEEWELIKPSEES